MAALVTKSEKALAPDVLPALKVCYYKGESKAGNIYTFARFYLHGQSLEVTLNLFEREPSPQSIGAFALTTEKENCLLVEFSSQNSALFLYKNGQKQPLPSLALQYFKGEDEQGWYWGVKFILTPELLGLLGGSFEEGDEFGAAVFKYRSDEKAFGASYKIEGDEFSLQSSRFSRFTIVSY